MSRYLLARLRAGIKYGESIHPVPAAQTAIFPGSSPCLFFSCTALSTRSAALEMRFTVRILSSLACHLQAVGSHPARRRPEGRFGSCHRPTLMVWPTLIQTWFWMKLPELRRVMTRMVPFWHMRAMG